MNKDDKLLSEIVILRLRKADITEQKDKLTRQLVELEADLDELRQQRWKMKRLELHGESE